MYFESNYIDICVFYMCIEMFLLNYKTRLALIIVIRLNNC